MYGISSEARIRRVENPPNPYDRYTVDTLGEPPPSRVEVYEEEARSILSQNDSPDLAFRWSVNPYRGCQHACAYCYARPTHEYLGLGAGTDFDTRIFVKVNAPALLRAALARPRWSRECIAFSGVTDCYQPQEATYELTRRCLEVCLAAGNPVTIVTKSFLITRDVDVLVELARRNLVNVCISIGFADERAARAIEPGAPRPARRFEAIRRLSDAGVPVGVLVAPLIPGLSDREVADVLRRAAECGACSAGYTALRLPGSVREVFLSRIEAALGPSAVARVKSRIRDIRGGKLNESRFGCRMRGEGPYWDAIRSLFQATAIRLGLNRERLLPEQALPVAAGPTAVVAFDGGCEGVDRGVLPRSAGSSRGLQLPLWEGE